MPENTDAIKSVNNTVTTVTTTTTIPVETTTAMTPVPSVETLRDQLKILNERSRWYTAQLWKIPFAYLGVSGFSIVFMNNQTNLRYALYCLVASVLGICVLYHTLAVKLLEKAAIDKLKDIEKLLHLRSELQAENIEKDTNPMIFVMKLSIAVYIVCGCYFLWTIMKPLLNIKIYTFVVNL